MTRRARLFGVLSLVVAFGSTARADELGVQGADASPQSEARERFRRASAAAQAGDWRGALALYRDSAERYPHATTLSNIGYCYERLGDDAAAMRETLRALSLGLEQPERGLDAERVAQAESALALLETRVGRIRLISTEPAVRMRVDGQALRPQTTLAGQRVLFTEATLAPEFSLVEGPSVLVLNPGSYVVQWRTGTNAHEQRVIVSAGRELELRLVEPASSATAPAPTRSVEPARSVPVPAQSSTRRAGNHDETLSQWAVWSFAASGVALATGAASGAIAWSTERRLDARCASDGACPPSQDARVDRFATAATVSNVAFGVGALALGAGIVVLLVERDSEPSRLQLRLSTRLELEGAF
jgi:hypothetical protein